MKEIFRSTVLLALTAAKPPGHQCRATLTRIENRRRVYKLEKCDSYRAPSLLSQAKSVEGEVMMRKISLCLLLVLFLFPAAATPGLIPARERAVPGEYMVLLREGVARRPDAPEAAGPSVDQVSAELARRYGGEVLSVWKYAVQGFAVRMKEPAARALAGDSRVRWVEQDYRIGLAATPSPLCSVGTPPTRDIAFPASPQDITCLDPVTDCVDNWGLDRVDQTGRDATGKLDSRYHFDLTGAGVHVYVIDSGIALDHEEFRDRNGNSRIGNGINKSGQGLETDLSDAIEHSHGTHVSAIIAGKTFGIAKEAIIHPVKVTVTEAATPRRIIDGIEWVAANRMLPAVANLSGANTEASWGLDSTLNQAALGLIGSGVALVQSAGNQNLDVCGRPPRGRSHGASMGYLYGAPEVIVVGGTNLQDKRYRLATGCSSIDCASNYGRCVDLWAPAQDILSAARDPLIAPGTTDPWSDAYCRLSGTSMAAPHATGVAALLLQRYDHGPNDRLPPGAVQTALRAAAVGGKLPTALPDGIGGKSPNLFLQSRFPFSGPPAVGDDYFRKGDDSLITVTYDQLLANDFDWEERTLTVVGVQSPSNGSITLTGNGFTYNPNGYTGTESFTYQVRSGSGLESIGTIFILDTRPVASDDHFAAEWDPASPSRFPTFIEKSNLLDNDFSPSGFEGFDANDQPISSITFVRIARMPRHGSLSFDEFDRYRYVPGPTFPGSDDFEYEIQEDGHLAGATAYITLYDIALPTLAPFPRNDRAETESGVPVTIDVKANDQDSDGQTLTLGALTAPSYGSLSISDEKIVYTPNASFAGFDSFTYTVRDPYGNIGAASVVVEVFPLPPGPMARDDFFTAERNHSLDIGYTGLLSNDSGAGLTLSPLQITDPQHGSLDICCSAEGFTYIPDPGFEGRDWFRYTVVDANNRSSTAVIWVNVEFINHPPDAVADNVVTEHNTAKAISVLANDTDVDQESLTLVSVTQPPSGGSVVINGGTMVTFTPTSGFSGTPAFDYTIKDPNNASDTTKVTVRVRAQNQPPNAADNLFPSFRNQPVSFTCVNLLANDTDPDQEIPLGDRLIVTSVGPAPSGSLSCSNVCNCTYTPPAGLTGQVPIPYTISDERPGGTAGAYARINISNRPPVAVADTTGTPPGTAKTISVLANDRDPDGDPITIQSITSQPAAGAGTCAMAAGNTAVIYTPPAGFLSSATCSYTIRDGLDTSAPATVTIYINRPPDARGDQFRVTATYSSQIAHATLLANDFDPDGNALTISSINTAGLAGTLSCPTTTCTYTPPPGFWGVTSFSYTTSDGRTGTDTATVKLKVGVTQSLPVAADDLLTTPRNTPRAFTIFDVLANDSDADGDVLSAVIISGPRDYGSMSCSTPAYNCTYTPNTGFVGVDRFPYSASDGADGAADASIKMLVLPPSTPVLDAREDQFITAQNQQAFFSFGAFKANDYDPERDPLTITSFDTSGLNGSLDCTSDPNGCIFRPALYSLGTTRFKYTVSDGHGNTDTAIVKIKVGAANTAPVAANDSFTMTKNTQLRFSIFELLRNDSDAENDPLNVTVFAYPSRGTVSCSIPNYWCTYTPFANVTGTDSFTYMASDGIAGTGQITITITINP